MTETLLQTIYSSVISFIVSVGHVLSTNFINQIYRQAALGYSSWHNNIIFLVVLVGLLSSFIINKEAKYKRIGITGLVLLIVLFFGSFLINSYITRINASFNQRFKIIDTKISKDEGKRLKAMWATMDSRNDYRNICDAMDIHERKHD